LSNLFFTFVKQNSIMKISIIGSGFSSLAASSYLAKAGHEVIVYEKLATLGGRARRFQKDGFTFDMGPTWYWMPDVFENFFRDFDKKPSDYYQLDKLDPGYSVYFENNEKIEVAAQLENIIKKFESIEKGSGEALNKFIIKAAKHYKIAIKDLVYKPGISFTELINWKAVSNLDQFIVTIKQEVGKRIKTKKLQQLLEFPVLFLGAKPSNTPGFYSFMNYADFGLGTWHPKKGMYSVVEAMVDLAKELGVKFETNSNVSKIETQGNKATGIVVNNQFLSVFYADFFPRPGKRNGAWMTSYRGQFKEGIVDHRPHVSIVCNFTKPTKTSPSLLTFNEVTTLFHEFGHALHGMLARGVYESLSGTSVFWDFVELPSQIFENWCNEKECLDLFAKHYQTGEIIPAELVEKIKKAANFQQGYMTLRQLSFALLDMAYHSQDPSQIGEIKAFEKEILKATELLPSVEATRISTSFSHIFQGGYAAGYYSYKWAEVLDADAFELFQEKGVFNAETSLSFEKNILSAGGSEHPSLLYARFRGREPKPDALLKRSGLVVG
jgi:hypothetical protein